MLCYSMQSIKQVLQKFNPTKDKYVSREFQSYGVHLSEELNDTKHKALYIRMAKTVHRSILEKALTFCVDSNARSKGALFMWKVQQLKKDFKTLSKPIVKQNIFEDNGKENPNFKTKKLPKAIQVELL